MHMSVLVFSLSGMHPNRTSMITAKDFVLWVLDKHIDGFYSEETFPPFDTLFPSYINGERNINYVCCLLRVNRFCSRCNLRFVFKVYSFIFYNHKTQSLSFFSDPIQYRSDLGKQAYDRVLRTMEKEIPREKKKGTKQKCSNSFALCKYKSSCKFMHSDINNDLKILCDALKEAKAQKGISTHR